MASPCWGDRISPQATVQAPQEALHSRTVCLPCWLETFLFTREGTAVPILQLLCIQSWKARAKVPLKNSPFVWGRGGLNKLTSHNERASWVDTQTFSENPERGQAKKVFVHCWLCQVGFPQLRVGEGTGRS